MSKNKKKLLKAWVVLGMLWPMIGCAMEYQKKRSISPTLELYDAVKSKNFKAVQAAIRNGARVNASTDDTSLFDETVLMMSCRLPNNRKITESLLDNGADCEICDEEAETAYASASPETVQLFNKYSPFFIGDISDNDFPFGADDSDSESDSDNVRKLLKLRRKQGFIGNQNVEPNLAEYMKRSQSHTDEKAVDVVTGEFEKDLSDFWYKKFMLVYKHYNRDRFVGCPIREEYYMPLVNFLCNYMHPKNDTCGRMRALRSCFKSSYFLYQLIKDLRQLPIDLRAGEILNILAQREKEFNHGADRVVKIAKDFKAGPEIIIVAAGLAHSDLEVEEREEFDQLKEQFEQELAMQLK